MLKKQKYIINYYNNGKVCGTPFPPPKKVLNSSLQKKKKIRWDNPEQYNRLNKKKKKKKSRHEYG